MLDAVTFAVFREGFRNGFGADGDHLKKPEEVEAALECGYTMITLDLSDHINKGDVPIWKFLRKSDSAICRKHLTSKGKRLLFRKRI